MTPRSAWLSAPKLGETENGDVAVVRTDGGLSLLAVIDALGHGQLAARVARAAEAYLRESALSSGALALMLGLHERLRGTRGAAGLLCIASDDKVEVCGVGNVEMRCTGTKLPVVLIPGIIGSNIRNPRAFDGGVGVGCRVAIFSDGVSSRFSLQEYGSLSAEDACRAIFDLGRRAQDDATVLVADLGKQGPTE